MLDDWNSATLQGWSGVVGDVGGWGGVMDGVGWGGTWYIVLGTKYLIRQVIMIILPSMVSQFDEVQTTLSKRWIFRVIGCTCMKMKGVMLTSHLAPAVGVLGPGDLRSAETLEWRLTEFGHSENLWAFFQEPFRPGVGPMGPTVLAWDS